VRSFDVIILGAGAAGLMAAIEAGRRGRTVLVLEKSAKPAEKIRISGGGRCNFTNLRCTPANFLSQNPRFCISALKRYTPREFLARVETAGIAWHEKTLGQLFCDGSSQQIIDLLLADAAAAGVVLQTESEALRVQQRGEGFHLTTNRGEVTCTSLVLAMIAAANADGHIGPDEQKSIFERVGRLPLDAEAKGFVFDALSKPPSLQDIANLAQGPEQAAELWLASRIAIDPDHPMEQAYLEALASRLALPGDLVAHLEGQARAALA